MVCAYLQVKLLVRWEAAHGIRAQTYAGVCTAPAARAFSERVSLSAALMSGTYVGISTLIQNRRGLLKKLERPAFDSVKPL